MGIRSERWLIQPSACPRPIRYCPTCGTVRAFICSERFRVNAQKKTIDVWLHYRCSVCSAAWKYPVLERQPIASLDAATYEAYVRHDRATVWKHAFDLARMRAHVLQVDADIGVIVERTVIEGGADDDVVCVYLEAPFSCEIRLDKLLATELQLSRAKIQSWFKRGRIQVFPLQNGALSKRARSGQRLLLSNIAKFQGSASR